MRVRCEIGPSTAWFSGDRVLEIPARGLDQVANTVRAATIPIVPDTSKGRLRFTGHVTVARTRRRLVDPAARMELAGIPLVSTFEAEHFDLVKSELHNVVPNTRGWHGYRLRRDRVDMDLANVARRRCSAPSAVNWV